MATKDELNNDKESLRIFDEKVRKKKEAFELDKQNNQLSNNSKDVQRPNINPSNVYNTSMPTKK